MRQNNNGYFFIIIMLSSSITNTIERERQRRDGARTNIKQGTDIRCIKDMKR